MDPFIGEIKMVGFNFAPFGWAFCNGQLLSIAENDALFALIGTTYGGDGIQTFAVPDLQGRIPMHWGHGPGLSTHVIGELAGTETVTLTGAQLPAHPHPIFPVQGSKNAADTEGGVPSPVGHFPARVRSGPSDLLAYATQSNGSVATTGATSTSDLQGGNQPHDNMAPFQCVTFVIALQGIYPNQG